jgi:hypothetical protein
VESSTVTSIDVCGDNDDDTLTETKILDPVHPTH